MSKVKNLDKQSRLLFEILESVKKIEDESQQIPFKKKLWRVSDLANYLGLSKGHIYNLSSQGMIPKIKKGKQLYFIPDQIFEWISKGDHS